MWFLWAKTIWRSLGRQASAIGVAILAVIGLIAGHKHKVKKSHKQGRKEGTTQERERIETETAKVSEKMKERADEVREDTADLGDHELADRLRAQQERLRNRNR